MTDGDTTHDGPDEREHEPADPGRKADDSDSTGREPLEREGPSPADRDQATAPEEGTTGDVTAAEDGPSRTRSVLLWTALGLLSLLAVVALLQFYINASAAIDRWVAAEYRRIMQAAFNLVVLLLSGVGIALVVRKLGD